MNGTISREQELAYRSYFEGGNSMDPSDCFDAGWKASQTHIRQLERQRAALAVEIDLQRPVVDAAVRCGYGQINTELGRAVRAYEAAKESGQQ